MLVVSMFPTVSVVIPCYRQARYLPLAIESALSQSYPHVEVVVVNDGSDDNTEEVAARYLPRIRYVGKPNGGLPSARNAGIGAATGKYLLFLDADDVIHPDVIGRMVEAAAGADDVLVQAGLRAFRHEVDDTDPDCLPTPRSLLPFLIHENVGPCHAILCSRSAVVAVGSFRTELKACEDWDLWLRLACAGARLVTIPMVGAYYRQYPGSMSTDLARMLNARAMLLLHLVDALQHDPRLRELYAEDTFNALRRVWRRCVVQGAPRVLNSAVSQAMRMLRAAGSTRAGTWMGRQLDRIPGMLSERIIMLYYRLIRPDLLAWYARTYR